MTTREERTAYKREWKRLNPEKARESDARQNAKRTPEERHRFRLKSCHKMTVEDWWNMFEEQLGCCYLCGEPLMVTAGPRPGRYVHIDHDHKCCGRGRSCFQCRRGLACARCNLLIGKANDNPKLLRQIADNLETKLECA